MIISGYEKPVEYGTQQIFDPTMAAMVLKAQESYNNAVKDEYERGLKDLDKFYQTYGDFMSPFEKDMQRYGEMIGGIRGALDEAYSKGINLLQSPEGRMLISRLTNSVNPAEFNMMRANAKTGYAYLDAIQDLRRKGKYSEAQELFDIMQSGGLGVDVEGNDIYDFSGFSTRGKNGWNSFMRTSPIEAATLQELTKSGYEGRQARLLSEADFEDERLRGKYKYDPKYEWSGYLYSDLLKNAPGAILSASADPRMKYFRHVAEMEVAASGLPLTEENINAQFQRDVANANTWALIDPTRKANEFALDDHKMANDIAAYKAKRATDHYYHKLENPPEETRRRNIFREAEALAPRWNAAHASGFGVQAGVHVGYIPAGQYEELIDPIVPGSYIEGKDKDSGQMTQKIRFTSPRIKDNVYLIDDRGNIKHSRIDSRAGDNGASTYYDFVPDGQMKAAPTPSGYRYYISGQMLGKGGAAHTEDGSTQVWIEVKERGYVYDGKRKKD